MSKYQYRIEPDDCCESPRELAEVWSTSDATMAELQSEGYTCLEFTGEVWGISAASLAKEFTSKEQALACLQAEHDAYIAWRSGGCYQYVVYEVQTCNLGHEHEVKVDSCGGFYGYTEAMQALVRSWGLSAMDELKARG